MWASGWLSGDPHAGTAGLYQKLVCVPVPCAGPGDLKQLQALCFAVPAGFFCPFTLAAITVHSDAGEKPFLNQLCWLQELAVPAG